MRDTQHTPRIEVAKYALLAYQQADMDGIMVLASRQAIHEVTDELDRLAALNAELVNAAKTMNAVMRDRHHGRMPDDVAQALSALQSALARARGES